MPEDTSCHAHTNENLAHRAELEVIRDTALQPNGRWLPMLNTTELKKRKLHRLEVERIALHDLIIAVAGVPNQVPNSWPMLDTPQCTTI